MTRDSTSRRVAATVGALMVMLSAHQVCGQWYCPGGVCPVPYGPAPGRIVEEYRPPSQPIVSIGQELARAIVVVTAHGSGQGSGVVVRSCGSTLCVATAFHVVEGGAAGYSITTSEGRRYEAEICARDEANDLAVLRVANYGATPVPLSHDASGALTAVGYGPNGRLLAIRGTATGYARPSGATIDSIKIRGAIRPGDSGGPLLNSSGSVVAILWGSSGGESYATPSSALRKVVDSCCGGDQPNEPQDGLLDPPSPSIEQRLSALETAAARQNCSCADKWKANELRLVKVESRLDQIDSRLTKIDATLIAVTSQAPPAIDYDKLTAEVLKRLPQQTPQQTPTSGDAEPGARVLYFTSSKGCPACAGVDAKIARLKQRGYPITVIDLDPTETTIRGVPRIHIPETGRNVEGIENCLVYLAQIVPR